MKQSKKLQDRAEQLRELKALYKVTYERLSSITGYHQGSLKRWAAGGDPLKASVLYSIRTALVEYARNQTQTLANDPYYQQRAKALADR